MVDDLKRCTFTLKAILAAAPFPRIYYYIDRPLLHHVRREGMNLLIVWPIEVMDRLVK